MVEGNFWLQYLKDENLMKCSTCVKYVETAMNKNPKCAENIANKYQFATGSNNFRRSTLTDHEVSSAHREAQGKKNAEMKPETTPAAQGLLALQEHTRKQITLKFRNVHALVKHNRPLSDYSWLCELDKAKGFDVGSTYTNRFACVKFLRSIADEERSHLSDIMSKADFFSISMDGTTDGGTKEQETLFIRTCVKGKTITRFLSIGEPLNTTSSILHGFVMEQLDNENLLPHMSKFVGFGSDGASNMIGQHGGLAALLKRDYPHIISIHCLAHRLELSFRDAIAKNANYEKLTTLLLGLYYFYKKSSKQRKGLLQTFEVRLYIF